MEDKSKRLKIANNTEEKQQTEVVTPFICKITQCYCSQDSMALVRLE